jgi:NADH dehydrogenase
MATSELSVVTGAFGYTGRYIARRLLAAGHRVKTLTGHPDRSSPFGDEISVAPFNFDDPTRLAEELKGATTLFNTYWVRFPHDRSSYDEAIANTETLIGAAVAAGVRRLVHISITNPSEDSSLPYFRGKAVVERAIVGSRLSHAIVRPTVIFGREDILINNIAWLLRRFPVFAIPGSGDYRLQPVFAEDLAQVAVDAATQNENIALDAAGPDIFAFHELVRLIRRTTGARAMVIRVPPAIALLLSRIIGRALGDVTLTRDELDGLMANLLVSGNPPTGRTRLGDWLQDNAQSVGRRYASELRRHYR